MLWGSLACEYSVVGNSKVLLRYSLSKNNLDNSWGATLKVDFLLLDLDTRSQVWSLFLKKPIKRVKSIVEGQKSCIHIVTTFGRGVKSSSNTSNLSSWSWHAVKVQVKGQRFACLSRFYSYGSTLLKGGLTSYKSLSEERFPSRQSKLLFF